MDTDVLQQKIQTLIYDAILKKIDRYFEAKEVEIGLDTLRIDRLELNLTIGALDGISTNLDLNEQVDEQMTKFFRTLPKLQNSLRSKKLRSTVLKESLLGQRLTEMNLPQNAREMEEMQEVILQKSPRVRKMETLIHFLETGSTPWWVKDSREMHTIIQDDVLVELLEADINFGIELKSLLQAPHILQRLTTQFTPLTVARVLIYVQHSKWADLRHFQSVFGPLLAQVSNLTRTQRFGFWQTFVRALRVQRFNSWKEKVLYEVRVLFSTNTPLEHPDDLFSLHRKDGEKMHPAEIALLLLALVEFNSEPFSSVKEYAQRVIPTLPENALANYVLPEHLKQVGQPEKTKKVSESSKEKGASSKKETTDLPLSNALNAASNDVKQNEEHLQNSPETDLESRFKELRKQHDKENEKRIRKLTDNLKDNDFTSSEALDAAWKDEEHTRAEESSRAEEIIDPEKGFIANHAGLLLLHPFMKAFCEKWDILDEDQRIKDPDKMVHILHYMATGLEQNSEFELTFEKFICGLDEGYIVDRNCVLPTEMKDGIDELLKAVLAYWDALKSSSIDLLRNGFLQRSARILANDKEIRLTFERKSADILIDRIPWTIGFLKLPWRKEMIHIEW